MKPRKKVVLFIVEGVSEETALSLPLEKLLANDSVRFDIVRGDITSKYSGTNISSKIGERVRDHCDENGFKREDLAEVVLLVDTDGAYIDKSLIIRDESHEKAHYTTNNILHKEPEEIIDSRTRKQTNLNRLISLPKVYRSVPFSMYFFSCNLDHVICGNANLISDNEKTKSSEGFRAKYHSDPSGFLSYFHSDEIAIGQAYNDSWEHIKGECNSLKRCSNFNVFLSPNAIRIPREFKI